MVKQVKFTKNQLKIFEQVKINANKAFDEVMKEKPYLYHESDRNYFVLCYADGFLKQLMEDGYACLEV